MPGTAAAGQLSARFSVSWPVYAGGYPSVDAMAELLSRSLEWLGRELEHRVRSVLGPECRVEGASILPALRGVEIVLTINAPETVIPELVGADHLLSLGAVVGDDLASGIKTFVLAKVPDARRGANAYDVAYSLGRSPSVS